MCAVLKLLKFEWLYNIALLVIASRAIFIYVVNELKNLKKGPRICNNLSPKWLENMSSTKF